jgi:hypothetical protein
LLQGLAHSSEPWILHRLVEMPSQLKRFWLQIQILNIDYDECIKSLLYRNDLIYTEHECLKSQPFTLGPDHPNNST